MRHLKRKRNFGGSGVHRTAMLRNMVTSLLMYERITTTLAKAREMRRVADKMITLGKNGSLAHRRRALGYIRLKSVVHKLFTSLAQRYESRSGGYTRIYKLGPRMGDNAPMAIVELVDRDLSSAPKRRTHPIKEEEEGKA